MARRRRVSFLARKKIKERVTFEARGRRISFLATVPSKRRQRIAFYTRKKRKRR